MSKAVISNRIYISEPPEGFEEIKKALTYKIIVKGATKGGKAVQNIEVIRNYKMLPRNIISIPQGRQDLIPEGYEILDKRVIVDMPFPTPTKALRPEQLEVFNNVNESCFINALVGWGKTFTALYCAMKLGQKTLVITHTTMLRDQWITEARELFDMDIGVIGSGEFDIDHAIVVGNIQTVTKHAVALSKEFGTIIMDEGHHCPASTFASLIDTMYARYRIGLSGTLIRKDGRHVLFKDYFGPVVHKPPQSHTLNPRVKIVRPGISLTPGEPWVKKINNLLYDPDYQDYIATIARINVQKGHRVLVVADRVEFLTRVKEILGEDCVLVTGETTLEERNAIAAKLETGEITSIAGSRQIFAEGISINILSLLILAGPISNEVLLEQLIGRIMRKHPDKLSPEVIDINFSGHADKKQNNLRLGFYMNKGWDIEAL